MKQQIEFLPAEVKLILEGNKTQSKELLKLIFMDLLLKGVLEINIVIKESSSRNYSFRKYKYISRGSNFSNYRPAPCEMVFLSPFMNSSSIQILFQHLITIGFQNARNQKEFKKTILNASSLENYISINLFQQIFGLFSLSIEGKEKKGSFISEINRMEKELYNAVKSDIKLAGELVEKYKGHIFLLSKFPFEFLLQIDNEILSELIRQGEKSGTYQGTLVGGFGCSSFDSGCFGCSNSGGDSGCSGCSGCGGCGGCGGGD